jgi:protoporphyrinogen oxidase
MKRKIYILGGGPAGLGAAYSLALDGEDVVLMEGSNQVGGLARTISSMNGVFHDIGPHKIFTPNKSLMELVRSFLPAENWMLREKRAAIYQSKVFLHYPPSIHDIFKILGLRIVPASIQFLIAQMSKLEPEDLPSYIRKKVGRILADEIILPAVEKVWGNLKDIGKDLGKTRIQTPNLKEAIFSRSDRKSSDFQVNEFFYPKGGLSALWEAIKIKSQDLGVNFRLNAPITKLESHGNKIIAIHTKGEIIALRDQDLVISTLSIFMVKNMLNIPSSGVKTTLDLKLVFLKMPKLSINDYSWIFVSDSKLMTHRVSSQHAFDPFMNGDNDVVCLEYMDRGQLPSSDSELCNLAENEILTLFPMAKVFERALLTLPNSYPQFSKSAIEDNKKSLEELSIYSNLITIGRHGAAKYVGSIDAFDMGLNVNIWTRNPNQKNHIKYRETTSFYPILD